ncbi:MAG: transketolase [Atopobiaceae bacterium]
MSTKRDTLPEARSVHEIELIANAMRHDIITMITAAKSGHPGGSLSCADLLATLYFSGVMHYDPSDPKAPWRDYLILSKGHAAPALYAAFHQLGWVKDEELPTLRHLGSRLQGHPDCKLLPGVEVCSGSLGQGLSVSSGVALGLRADAKATGSKPAHVFCVCGDGEMQEGSNWEALMYAAHRHLDNLTMYLDLNNLQIDGNVNDVNSLGDIHAKLAAFGWNVLEVDGHDVAALIDVTRQALQHEGQPTAVICHTVKGKGVPFMEDQVDWHGKAPSEELAAEAIDALDQERDRLLREA